MEVQIEITASRQLKEIQNTTNPKNRHIVFWIFIKKPQENGRYFIFIVKPISLE